MPLLSAQAHPRIVTVPHAQPRESRASNDGGSTLPHYIARVQAIQPLSREEEYELACRVRDSANDEEAARKLVEANLRYVVAIALSYRRYGVRLADLISEGNVGLMIALKKFDPTRGTRFVTYAAHWIRAYVLDHVIRAWSIVGVGAGPLRSKVFFRLRREKAKILASTSDSVVANERLAESFGTTSEKIALLANRLEARDVSLDAKVFDDGAATVLDTVPGPGPSQEEEYLSHERFELGPRVRPRSGREARPTRALHRRGPDDGRPRRRALARRDWAAPRRLARARPPARGAREAEASQAPRDACGRALERGLRRAAHRACNWIHG